MLLAELFGHIRYVTLGGNPGMRLLLITVLIKCPFIIHPVAMINHASEVGDHLPNKPQCS